MYKMKIDRDHFLYEFKNYKNNFHKEFCESNLFPCFVLPSQALCYLVKILNVDVIKKLFYTEYTQKLDEYIPCQRTIFWITFLCSYIKSYTLFMSKKCNKKMIIQNQYRREFDKIQIEYNDNMEFLSNCYDKKKDEKREEVIELIQDTCIKIINLYENFIFRWFLKDSSIKKDAKIYTKIEEISEPVALTTNCKIQIKNNKTLHEMIINKRNKIMIWNEDDSIDFRNAGKCNDAITWLIQKDLKPNVKTVNKILKKESDFIDVWTFYHKIYIVYKGDNEIPLLNRKITI